MRCQLKKSAKISGVEFGKKKWSTMHRLNECLQDLKNELDALGRQGEVTISAPMIKRQLRKIVPNWKCGFRWHASLATGWKHLPCYMFEISTRMVNQGENCIGSKAQRKGRWIVTLQTNYYMPTCTTDQEVIYGRGVGEDNIMKIFTERVYCQRNRKDVEETHKTPKISCLYCWRCKKGLGMEGI